jgi:predicted component of type VI protein secretion system
MAKKESVQKRLQKVRPPRVQLTYDVEKGDAIEQKELPFVVGVVADLSGQSEVPQPKLRDRKFVNIDRASCWRHVPSWPTCATSWPATTSWKTCCPTC